MCSSLEHFLYGRKERLEYFEAAYRLLQVIQPTETDMCIHAVTDPDEPAVHVFGINGRPFGGQENVPAAQCVLARFNLSATDWQEWLGMYASEGCLQQFSASDIAALCLQEMTYFGFSPGQIQRRISESLQEDSP